MTTNKMLAISALLALALVNLPALAEEPADHVQLAVADSTNWQWRRLMQPTASEIAREEKGEVVIYDLMTDKEVELAMTEHFERIPSMMFVRTVITEKKEEEEASAFPSYQDEGC
jgi:hypothetical protein